MAANLSKRWRVDTLLFCLFSLPMVAVFLLGFATPAKAQGAVLCTCYCGARLYPPCSEEACKSACGYSEPRQGGGEGGGGGGGRVTRPPANPCARWPATVYDRGQNRCVCPGGS